MKKQLSVFLCICFLCSLLWQPMQVHAMNIIPINVKMYTTSGTPVYASPDLHSGIICVLERFVNVTVTGITENGFYQVDFNGNFYIPGPFLINKIEADKTAKQIALDNLKDFAEAYRIQLEQMESYSSSFALKDITGDGIPELFDSAGKEIYTYYEKRAVMIYYAENADTFYYSKNNNRLAGKYKWKDKEYWEVFAMDYSLMPWGQLKCYSTDISPIKSDLTEISRSYTNNAETRNDMYNILKKILSL